jgi:uncharacterized protein
MHADHPRGRRVARMPKGPENGKPMPPTAIKPCIRSLMPVYEQNYRLMMRFMPGLRSVRAPLTLMLDGLPAIRVSILECGPWTGSGLISQALACHQPRFLRDLLIGFRVYHDAQLLEVVAYQGRTRFAPYYPYPNRDMRSPFEKRRVNLFLGEWLRSRLRLGQRLEAAGGVPTCLT